jgi:hypothetical protein
MTDYNLIIFLVIIGAAAVALMAYAVARVWGNFENPTMERFSDEQVLYMREVRARNLEYLAWMMRGTKPQLERQVSYVVSRLHRPMVSRQALQMPFPNLWYYSE